VWRAKQTTDSGKPSANIHMALLLPEEFKAPRDQDVYSDFDESEYEELVARLAFNAQAIFDKPVKHRHLKALYLKGFIDGKPMEKMLVDGGASVNLMLYTTFRKLSKGPEDLIKIDMKLRDFGGNLSNTRGAINVELTIGSKTLITTFFVIDGKGSYSLLRGRDWIHANCCIPSTMHQCLVQWLDDNVEIVQAYDSVSVATVDPAYWDLENCKCFSRRDFQEDFINNNDESQ
jgi:hypothetical protein